MLYFFLTNALAVGTDLSITVYLCHRIMCECHMLPCTELQFNSNPRCRPGYRQFLCTFNRGAPLHGLDWIRLAYVLPPIEQLSASQELCSMEYVFLFVLFR
jgi:hypothetical protein